MKSDSNFVQWRLKGGADKRFRSGHPWVYSNELAESPKGLEPGSPVELKDAGGKFLARGYGNPSSLIAFRAVSRDPAVADPLASAAVVETLLRAGRMRAALGLGELSHRLCFGESDGLPGLIIDRYRLQRAQIFVVQAHTAGADRLVARLEEILKAYVDSLRGELNWGQTGIVLRNDVGVRKLEGLVEEEPRVLREAPGVEMNGALIRVPRAGGKPGEHVDSAVDLLGGQKTGFFLDQAANVALAAARFGAYRPAENPRRIRILDLCCYVGQWSAQLARTYREAGLEVEVVLVDASARALELARTNVEAAGARVETLKGDVLRDLSALPDRSFDLVVCDPPALVKGRKDLPAGTHAYLQLNTQAFRLVRAAGLVVTCSCSGLLPEEDFVRTLSKAAYRNARTVRWVGRGGPAPDHPMLAEFPEGRYLKCWLGCVDF